MPTDLTTFGVTDEAVAIRATTDYFQIAPRDQQLAEGDDGQFDTLNRWTLSSPGAAFLDDWMVPGSMLEIALPKPGTGRNGQPVTRDKPDHLAIVSAPSSTYPPSATPSMRPKPVLTPTHSTWSRASQTIE